MRIVSRFNARDDPWHRAQIFAETTEDHELVDPQISADAASLWSVPRRWRSCDASATDSLRLYLLGSTRAASPHPYSEEDYKTMLEDGMVRVRCEFCSRTYRFLPADLLKSD